jgi:CheY-like chemotaxis protein
MPASIYVADDEPALRNALVKRLSQSQHQVQAFKSGDELLAAVEQGLPTLPDLILLDLKMPGRTGLETLEALRAKAKDTLVIILTSYGTVEEAVEAMKRGVRLSQDRGPAAGRAGRQPPWSISRSAARQPRTTLAPSRLPKNSVGTPFRGRLRLRARVSEYLTCLISALASALTFL